MEIWVQARRETWAENAGLEGTIAKPGEEMRSPWGDCVEVECDKKVAKGDGKARHLVRDQQREIAQGDLKGHQRCRGEPGECGSCKSREKHVSRRASGAAGGQS